MTTFPGVGPNAVDPDAVTSKTEFGAALTEVRQRAGLGVRHVVTSTGLPRATLGDYFSGRSLPRVDDAASLTAVLRACGITDPVLVDRWQATLLRVRRHGRRPPPAGEPYRGLEHYDVDDGERFHGRARLVDRLAAALTRRHPTGGLVIVVGASGSGKSSLLRAGLIGSLTRGDLDVPDAAAWPPPLLLTPGRKPLPALAAQLAERVPDVDAAAVLADLRRAPASCADLVRRARPGDDEPDDQRRLLIVVDQFEELFAPDVDGGERASFVAALDAAAGVDGAGAPRAMVVVGLRSDFCTAALDAGPALVSALQDAAVVVTPMSADELRDAIRSPATTAGGELEPGLVELIARDLRPPGAAGDATAAHGPGALPFLSHALLTTWRAGLARDRRMTIAGYLAEGGIDGAVSRTADAVLADLAPDQRRLARQLFLRLVRVADDGVDTLRRLGRAELVDSEDEAASAAFEEVVGRFAAQRLVTVDDDVVEISHVALLTAWPQLRSWIDADRENALAARRLADAARAWDSAGRNADDLYAGPRLEAARTRADAAEPALTAVELAFLRASVDRQDTRDRDERRRQRFLRRLTAVACVSAVLAAAIALFGFVQRGEALDQRNAAVSSRVAAEAQRLRGSDPALAAQLALAASRLAPTPQARSSLLDTSASPTVTRALGTSAVRQTLAVGRDGALMATAGADAADPSLRLWDLADRKHPRVLGSAFHGPPDAVYGLALSPDDRTLVAAGPGGAIWTWDVADPRHPVARAAGAGGAAGATGTTLAAAYSPDGHTLALGGTDHTVRLLDLSDPTRPAPLGPALPLGDAVQALAFSPDGRTLAAGDASGAVRLWGTAGPATPLGPPLAVGPAVFALAFDPSGTVLATGGDDKEVRLWSLADPGRPAPRGAPMTGATGRLSGLSFSPDGAMVAAASSDNTARVWDTSSGREVAALPHPGLVTHVQFLPGPATALTTAAVDGAVRIWTLPGPVITEPTSIVFTTQISTDGRWLLVGHDGNAARDPASQKVRLWDITEPDRPTALGPPMGADGGRGLSGAAALSPDRRTVAAGTLAGPVYLWDVRDPARPVAQAAPLLGSTDNVESVAFSPDGTVLAVAGDDRTVRLWDVTIPARPRPLATLTGPAGKIGAVAFAPSGRLLAAAGGDHRVWLWDITDPGRPAASAGGPLDGPTQAVDAVAFSPDGQTLAAGSEDATVRLWDVHDPAAPSRLGGPLAGPDNAIYWLTFDPAGHRLAAAGGDGTVWLWDVTQRDRPTTYATLTAQTGEIWFVSFGPTGRTLAAGGNARTARLWDTDPDTVAATICATTGDPLTPEEWAVHFPDLDYDPPCRS